MSSFYSVVREAFPPGNDQLHGVIYESSESKGQYRVLPKAETPPGNVCKLTTDEISKRLFAELEQLSLQQLRTLSRIVTYLDEQKESSPLQFLASLFCIPSPVETLKRKVDHKIQELHPPANLLSLPNDIKMHIFSFLPQKSLQTLPLICRALRATADNNDLWKNKFVQDFGSFPAHSLRQQYPVWQRLKQASLRLATTDVTPTSYLFAEPIKCWTYDSSTRRLAVGQDATHLPLNGAILSLDTSTKVCGLAEPTYDEARHVALFDDIVIASFKYDGLKMWNTSHRNILGDAKMINVVDETPFRDKKAVANLYYSKKKQLLMAGNQVWHFSTNTWITLHDFPYKQIRFNETQNEIIGCSHSRLAIFDPLTGACKRSIDGHFDFQEPFYFDEERQLLIACPNEHSLAIYNATTLNLEHELAFDAPGRVYHFSYDPLSARLIASHERVDAQGMHQMHMAVWDVPLGKKLIEFPALSQNGLYHAVYASVYFPGSKLIVTADHTSTLQVWAEATGQLLRTLSLPYPENFYPMTKIFRDTKSGCLTAIGQTIGGDSNRIMAHTFRYQL